eukprot:1081671-Pelagomonas_calceolata.AAC.1
MSPNNVIRRSLLINVFKRGKTVAVLKDARIAMVGPTPAFEGPTTLHAQFKEDDLLGLNGNA